MVLKALNKEFKPIKGFHMVVCTDGNIFFDQIENKLNKSRGGGVFVSVPVRLGLNTI